MQIGFLVAVTLLFAGWALSYGLGLRMAGILLDAFLLALITNALFGIAGATIINLAIAIRGR